MSTYEDDHNINQNRPNEDNNGNQRARQHQTLSSIIDSFLTRGVNDLSETNFEVFSNALRVLNAEEGSTVALDLIQSLETFDNPESLFKSKERGVSQEFLDSLERVPVESLENKDSADCPICTNKFIDDEYPLLVKLPCSVQHKGKTKDHIFDLECIGPWLKVNSTCPLCRFDVLEVDKKRRAKLEEELSKIQEEDSEEEEDDWGFYG